MVWDASTDSGALHSEFRDVRSRVDSPNPGLVLKPEMRKKFRKPGSVNRHLKKLVGSESRELSEL